MAERTFEVTTFGVAYDCDECGEEVRRTGSAMRMSSPPQVEHECPNGHTVWLAEFYPTVRHQKKGPDA